MKSSKKSHLLLVIIAAIPLYWGCLYYIELAAHEEIEELAFAATIGAIGFVYVGRYFAILWATQHKSFRNLLSSLALSIISCVIWLFIHADFPLEKTPALNLLLFWVPAIVLSIASGMLLKLIRINIAALEDARVDVANREGELKLLQSQLSPHFLFNTLNNLYGISMTRHEQVPGLLLKLSELLRYAVYDAKADFVLLTEEIDYINNYIEFEKIRLGDRLKITLDLETKAAEQIYIAPMLLIVFIENAFKHARNSTDEYISIEISLKIWAGSILFSIRNSFQGQENPNLNGKNSGLGLENVYRRLHLLYSGTHDLQVETENGFYQVTLRLKVK